MYVLSNKEIELTILKDASWSVWWNWFNVSGENSLILSISLWLLFSSIISPWKWRDPSFKQVWTSITQAGFVSSLVENDYIVLEKIFKGCKYLYGSSPIIFTWQMALFSIQTTESLGSTKYA